MRLIITRHGQTEDNAKSITMGQRDSPLTALGIRQAQDKAFALKNSSQKIDLVYCSDLGRCVQTAKIITEALGLPEATRDKGLREITFGDYEGLPYSAIPQEERRDMQIKFPGGESNEIMAGRVIDAVNRIYNANENACVLIVAHSGPIAAILASYYGKDLQTTLADKFGNDEVVELQVEGVLALPVLQSDKQENDIRNFVKDFREKIEPYWTEELLWEKFTRTPEMPKSAGYCGPSSVLLCDELRRSFPTETFSVAVGRAYANSMEWIHGKHVWVVWHHELKSATVIDVTADQSGKIEDKVIVEDIDTLCLKGINYIPYQLSRSNEEVDESPRKRAALLKKKLNDGLL